MRNQSNTRRKIRSIVSLACDGQLDERAANELERLLSSERGAVDDYVQSVAVASLIEREFSQHLPDLATLPRASDNTSGCPAQQLELSNRDQHRERRSWSRWSFAVASLVSAACIILVAGWQIAPWLRGPVATVIAVNDSNGELSQQFAVGDLLRPGWVETESGLVQLKLDKGALVAIRGPARMRVVSGNRCEIQYGYISSHVPESAHGFVIEAPVCEIEDLGTGFELNVSENGRSRVQVTEGQVRLTTIDKSHSEVLAAGIGGEVDAEGNFTLLDKRMLEVSKAARFIAEHPGQLAYKKQTEDDTMWVFLERTGISLSDDQRVDVAHVGRHTTLTSAAERITAGHTVDSYLVHCAPSRRRHVVEATVRFPNEVLGIICGSDLLTATNDSLGSAWTLRCTHPQRGLESVPDRNFDVVSLGADRRTVSFIMRTEAIDQVRVLTRSDVESLE